MLVYQRINLLDGCKHVFVGGRPKTTRILLKPRKIQIHWPDPGEGPGRMWQIFPTGVTNHYTTSLEAWQVQNAPPSENLKARHSRGIVGVQNYGAVQNTITGSEKSAQGLLQHLNISCLDSVFQLKTAAEKAKPPELSKLIWLVVEPPLWRIWVRQLGWLFPVYNMESHKIPWFQPTNQVTNDVSDLTFKFL